MMYKIVRFYEDDKMRGGRALLGAPHNGMTIKDGLTLEEAQEHCDDPETRSSTCSDDTHEQQYGPWFDGYTEE